MLTGLIVTSVVAALALAACGVLWAQGRALERDRARIEAERQRLAGELDAHRARLEQIRDEHVRLQVELKAAEERRQAMQESFEQARDQARDTFKALAGDTLRQSIEDFRKQAEQMFRSEQEKSGKAMQTQQVAIESLLKPVRESLGEYQKKLLEAEKQRSDTFGALREQARQLSDDQRRLREETANLVKALRRPEVRGRWGELQMQRLFELAGLSERVDYDAQAAIDSAGGASQRPDFVVHLPNDRVIVIDVKTPIDAYLDATESPDETARREGLDRHARQMQKAVDNLASKGYWESCRGSPEFVVMFVPGEAMLYAALQQDPDLIERAMARNVIPATPTVVMALLKTVAMGWREKSLAENARQIAALGQELHERLATVLEYVEKVGDRIRRTVEDYNRLVGSVETRLLPTARKLEDLHARSAKALPESLDPLAETARETRLARPGDPSDAA